MGRSSQTIHVIGFCGSPRTAGNSTVLLDAVLRGAADAGAAVQKVSLADLSIAPCRACDACLKTGVCIQHDDMEPLVESMKESHIWVLATPVYWWGPSAQLKAFVDRWYAPWHNADTRMAFAGKRAVLVAAMGDTNAGTARHTVGMLSDALHYLDMKISATVLAPGVHDLHDIDACPNLIREAEHAGRDAVTSTRPRG